MNSVVESSLWANCAMNGHKRRSWKNKVDSLVGVHLLGCLTCNLRCCTCLKWTQVISCIWEYFSCNVLPLVWSWDIYKVLPAGLMHRKLSKTARFVLPESWGQFNKTTVCESILWLVAWVRMLLLCLKTWTGAATKIWHGTMVSNRWGYMGCRPR